MQNRPGFTLAELLVVMVVSSLIAASIAQLMTVQSQFMHRQEGRFNARAVARGPIGLMLSDLRMIDPDSGVIAASATSITVRAPVANAISCGTSGNTTIMVQPLDSTVLAEALAQGGSRGYSGWAYTDANGKAWYRDGVGNLNLGSGSASTCTGAGLVSPTAIGFRVAQLTSTPNLPPGTPIFLYQKITYEFDASTSVPGRLGLFRTVVDLNTTEEIVAPFDDNAQFAFYVQGSATPQAAAPADLKDLRGIELQLTGLNERTTNITDAERVPLRTAVFFKN